MERATPVEFAASLATLKLPKWSKERQDAIEPGLLSWSLRAHLLTAVSEAKSQQVQLVLA